MQHSIILNFALAVPACLSLAVAAAGQSRSVTEEDYARAEQYMPYHTAELVLQTVEEPAWLADGRLWYRSRGANGISLILVDPDRRRKSVVADGQKLLRALGKANGEAVEPDALQLETLRLSEDGQRVVFAVDSQPFECDAALGGCERVSRPGPPAMPSPDGKREVFVRDWNLVLREVATGKETQLTTDGVENFGYATDNSARRHTDGAVVLWSPNSRRIATFRQDQRQTADMYLVRMKDGRPELDAWKYATPRDREIPVVHRVIIEIDGPRIVKLDMPPDLVRSASWLGLAHERTGELEAQWSADSSRLAFISVSRDHRHATLRIADAASGAVRTVLEERESAFYESAATTRHALPERILGNWRLLDGSDEVIWYSARSGWNHLYLYDLSSGELKRTITSGDWNVTKLLSVDEKRRTAYLQAVGRESGSHPYHEQLYAVDLDGPGTTRLTPETASHDVTMAPASRYFLDSFSTTETPPVSVLRDAGGKLVMELEKTDISRLAAKGWQPPAPITVKARDGKTELYGLMFTPQALDEKRKYPVINAIYPGPQIGSTFGKVASFATNHGIGDPQSLAELGFVVIMIDGMGTPLRSRAFGEATYGDYADSTLPDQVAGMKELAGRHSWIDLDRAGIYGLSGGGYAAARAMFAYPDFFSVGVAMAGNHDPSLYMDEFSEKYLGLLDWDGEGLANYADQSNVGLAGNLEGKLLLVHGTMDDNVPPYQTLMLVDALIEANRDFDLLMLPNQRHNAVTGASGRYLVRRYWDYFVRHLMGAEPPREYAMAPVER